MPVPAYQFEQLPFYFTTSFDKTNGELPCALPFSVGIDEKTGRIIQCPNRLVSETLEQAYRQGSLVTGYMEESGIGRRYADDFLEYAVAELGRGFFSGARVLEVGCGTGYLLHRIKEFGAEVCGIEPGPQGQLGRERYGVDIVCGYFPCEEITGKFDLIVQYAVLEHLEDPGAYLESLRGYLAPGGKILVAVPSCDEQVQFGDISMFFHEHWSYFTKESLAATLECHGFGVASVRRAGFGGVWYTVADPAPPARTEESVSQSFASMLERFARNQQCLGNLLTSAARGGRSIGFYCPGRIVNGLLIARSNCDLDRLRIRFFDDNVLIQGHYYPGFEHVIETRQALIAEPVDLLVIASWTFAAKISSSLRSDGYRGEIATFAELMAS